MLPLHRHLLAHVNPAAWEDLEPQACDDFERECIAHWKAARLPLLVTRQPADFDEKSSHIAMCIQAPIRWGRRKIGLRVARKDVLFFDEFPLATRVTRLLPANAREAWGQMCAAFHRLHASPRVYGSYGWQQIAGGGYVHRRADLSLWVQVTRPDEADEISAILSRFQARGLRLDGELHFGCDAAVPWRDWRDRKVRQLEAMQLWTTSAPQISPSHEALPDLELAEALDG